MPSKRGQLTEFTYLMILFVRDFQNRQIYRDRKQSSGCLVPVFRDKGWQFGMIDNGYGIPSLGNENILMLIVVVIIQL